MWEKFTVLVEENSLFEIAFVNRVTVDRIWEQFQHCNWHVKSSKISDLTGHYVAGCKGIFSK